MYSYLLITSIYLFNYIDDVKASPLKNEYASHQPNLTQACASLHTIRLIVYCAYPGQEEPCLKEGGKNYF